MVDPNIGPLEISPIEPEKIPTAAFQLKSINITEINELGVVILFGIIQSPVIPTVMDLKKLRLSK